MYENQKALITLPKIKWNFYHCESGFQLKIGQFINLSSVSEMMRFF